MYIETEETPNPNVIKFLPGRPISPDGPLDFPNADAAKENSPFAEMLFRVEGVNGVFLGADFISVTRAEGEDWAFLKTDILAAIMDGLMQGTPMTKTSQETDVKTDDDDPLTTQIKAILDEHVRPAVAMDGGDIIFDRFDEESGVVYLHLRGACAGCPSSTMTLKSGVENLLQHFVPEVKSVEAVL